jgi:hypothetical protein
MKIGVSKIFENDSVMFFWELYQNMKILCKYVFIMHFSCPIHHSDYFSIDSKKIQNQAERYLLDFMEFCSFGIFITIVIPKSKKILEKIIR